ncbi:hypothetical protein KFL_004290010, partial [Klebsormidium nitens]
MGSWATFVVLLIVVATSAVDGRDLPARRRLTQTGATAVFIDEIHWDNLALDFGEAIEIFGPLGLNVSGYVVTRYSALGQACVTVDCAAKGGQFTLPTGTTLLDPANTG